MIKPLTTVVHIAQVPEPTVEEFINRYDGMPATLDTEQRLLEELRRLGYADQAQQQTTANREAIKTVIHYMLSQVRSAREQNCT